MCEEDVYIYHLPYLQMRDLCKLLDHDNKWEELAGHMKYDVETVYNLRLEKSRGNSASEELLIKWGHLNHTVLELFILFSRMHHYRAMLVIQDQVPKTYHRLIKEGEFNLAKKMAEVKINNIEQCARDYGNARENFYNENEHVKKINKDPLKIEKQQEPVALVNRGVDIVNNNNDSYVTRDDNESLTNNEPKRYTQSLLPLPRNGLTTKTSSTTTNMSSVVESAGPIPQISYEELSKATNNWHESTILGKGGFGTVYKGIWKCTHVAIKRLEQRDSHPDSVDTQMKQSSTELHCLNAYRHDNILPVYGYSYGGDHPCLVYQYMSGGCLEQRLRTKDPAKQLGWLKRLYVAIGTARGLQFLHTSLNNESKPLIHGDIKSANILLDPNDQPKIGDFGLAREGPQNNYTHMKVSRIQGTIPYLPDEFLRGKKFSTKIDTYSFGVVLFEIATGRCAGVKVVDKTGKSRNRYLKEDVVKHTGDVLELIDKSLPSGGEAYFRSIIDIGKRCVNDNPKERPEMVSVLIDLEDVLKQPIE